MQRNNPILALALCSTLLTNLLVGAPTQAQGTKDQEEQLFISTAPTVEMTAGANTESNPLKSDTDSLNEVQLSYEGQEIPEIDQRSHQPPTRRDQLQKKFLEQKDLIASGLPQEHIFIPELPHEDSHFAELLTLNDMELDLFLRKKSLFMNRFARTMEFFRLKKPLINKALLELNSKFGAAIKLVAKSNSVGGTVMLSLSTGLALPRKIIESLKGTRIGTLLPKSGGFLYLLGFGAGISRTKISENKSTWTFDIFIDAERLKSSLTGLAEISAAATYGVVYEHRDEHFISQKTDTIYGGVAGAFRQGENQFSWTNSTGIAVPPGVSIFIVYTNKTTRHYLLRIDGKGIRMPALLGLTKLAQQFLRPSWLRLRGASQCTQALHIF